MNRRNKKKRLKETGFVVKRCYFYIPGTTSSKVVAFLLIDHGITDNKKSVKLLLRTEVSIPCTDVFKQIKHFCFDTQIFSSLFPN